MAQIENRYANALLELSLENHSLESDLAEAVMVKAALEDEETLNFLMHPHIPEGVKLDLIKSAFGNCNERLQGFLRLLIDKNRESILSAVIDDYIRQAEQKLGRVEAKVVSAKALSDEQIARMLPLLGTLTKKDIRIKNVIDPDVIGGFYVLVDGHVFDATIRSELHKMKETLKKGGRNASKTR